MENKNLAPHEPVVREGASSRRAWLVDVFESKVEFDPNTGCWLWAAPLSSDGYGIFGHAPYSRRANRASYQLYRGEIPSGLYILHRCDTPACVNPAHLRCGTPAENVADSIARQRRRNVGMTHCHRGHPYDAETYVRPSGKRECRTCTRTRRAAYYAGKTMRGSADDANAALRTAIWHIEHMAAWIAARRASYSFEALNEDMPALRAALDSQIATVPLKADGARK